MKTKKTVITVLTVALLVSAAIIVGCTNDSDGFTDKYAEETFKIPPGKGVLKIKFADSNSRTIVPVPTLSSYTYNLQIGKGGSPVVNQPALTYTQLTIGAFSSIALDVGTGYSISLVAKNGDGDEVAGWNNNNATFNITTAGTQLNASLTAKQDGQGTFTYTIKKAVNGTTTFDVLNLAGTTSIGDTYYGAVNNGETPKFPITVPTAGTEDTITLDSGFYLVRVTATSATTQTIQYVHVLHIYDNMDSELEQDLSGITLAVDRFTVTYHQLPEEDTLGLYDDTDDEVVSNVYYGTVLTARTKDVGGTDIEGPVFDTNSFGGWYTTSTYDTGSEWTMGTSRVFGNVTLYAKSIPAGSATGDLALSISFTISDLATIVASPSPVSRATFFASGGQIVLTATGMTSPTWSIGGDPVGTGTTLTINNSATFAKYLAGSGAGLLVVNAVGGNYSKVIQIPLTD